MKIFYEQQNNRLLGGTFAIIIYMCARIVIPLSISRKPINSLKGMGIFTYLSMMKSDEKNLILFTVPVPLCDKKGPRRKAS